MPHPRPTTTRGPAGDAAGRARDVEGTGQVGDTRQRLC